MFKTTTLALCAALLTTTAATAAFADGEGELKYRQSVMKSIGGHMGAIAGIMKGSTANTGDLVLHANGLAALSGIAGNVFPEGSDFGETTALPVIWEKKADFAAAVKKLQDAATGFAAAAKGGDMAATGAAFNALGEACKNCHENFREKKQ